MKNYNFNTAYNHLRELYGLELNPDEFENIGLIAWDKIGNKNVSLYRYEVVPTIDDEGNYVVDLPCNCDIIESVTSESEDYQKTTNQTNSVNNTSAWIESYVESRKFNTNPLYQSGKYIKYHRVNDKLYLADKFDKVKILYKGVILDDEGLPYINEKEIDAIAAYCAYVYDWKKARQTKDQGTMMIAQKSEQIWKSLCTQARIPDYITQNEMDEILNVTASWDRKRYGKSYKPIR